MSNPFLNHTDIVSEELILGCHITGVYDVNRNNILKDDDFGLVEKWATSTRKLNLKAILFHNNFSENTQKTFESEYLSFVDIKYDTRFNPNVFRYYVYREFLKTHSKGIESIFVTDVSDVVVVKNPFKELLFLTNPDTLFCGDEPKILENDWMIEHASHLRSKIPDYALYENNFKDATLLNCGVIGGNVQVMNPFLDKLWYIHETYNDDNKTAFTGDMGAFNYLVRTQFNTRLIHGAPVNTVFKMFEETREDCWFRHK
ncbi:hypothetical protein VB264_13640 [Arcicella aquatica]|uniref:Uncharacterized protein n=1 Tax=Arcicella aquatica TaxID=217141 RepID=A0ABU5QQ22_9BACT|nr:hypothetical protein [Arcicella aquatica]MEA5258834.1 hypothetical protein [Arcicella aquatica]